MCSQPSLQWAQVLLWRALGARRRPSPTYGLLSTIASRKPQVVLALLGTWLSRGVISWWFARADPGVVSGWHHHRDYDVYGYIVRGSARFENGPGGRDAISVGPGDFFHVPARTVHRDVNPSGTEGQEVILFLRGSGPMVINVEGPDPA
jgi:mannose-6-phosphate isomerase-like protein (cupin superfamily)